MKKNDNTVLVQTRISRSVHRTLTERARGEGISTAAFIRRLIFGATYDVKPATPALGRGLAEKLKEVKRSAAARGLR